MLRGVNLGYIYILSVSRVKYLYFNMSEVKYLYFNISGVTSLVYAPLMLPHVYGLQRENQEESLGDENSGTKLWMVRPLFIEDLSWAWALLWAWTLHNGLAH